MCLFLAEMQDAVRPPTFPQQLSSGGDVPRSRVFYFLGAEGILSFLHFVFIKCNQTEYNGNN